jgi:hypothetical protein
VRQDGVDVFAGGCGREAGIPRSRMDTGLMIKAGRWLGGRRCRMTAVASIAGLMLTVALVSWSGSPHEPPPTGSTTDSSGHGQQVWGWPHRNLWAKSSGSQHG